MNKGSIKIGKEYFSKSKSKQHVIDILINAKANTKNMKNGVVLYLDEVNAILKILKQL